METNFTGNFEDHVKILNNDLAELTENIEIRCLEKRYTAEMIYELNMGNSEFIQKYPQIKDLEESSIFRNFEFNPHTITKICVLGQNGLTLQEIEEKLQLERSECAAK